MIRIAALLLMLTGSAVMASGRSGDSDTSKPSEAVEDESMLPHVVSRPGSYVSLPEPIMLKIREKILASTGKAPAKKKTASH